MQSNLQRVACKQATAAHRAASVVLRNPAVNASDAQGGRRIGTNQVGFRCRLGRQRERDGWRRAPPYVGTGTLILRNSSASPGDVLEAPCPSSGRFEWTCRVEDLTQGFALFSSFQLSAFWRAGKPFTCR